MSEAKQGKIDTAPKNAASKKAPVQKKEEAPKAISPRERQKQRLEEARVKDNKMVRGRFEFKEVPGGIVTFPYRKHKADGIKWYTFHDGQIYTIPIGLAKHLNSDCRYPVHAHKVQKDWIPGVTRPDVTVGRYESRMAFHSLDFIDTSDPSYSDAIGPSPEIVTVQHG